MIRAVSKRSLSVVHVFRGENVVVGGDDGQVWVATFADEQAAETFVNDMEWDDGEILGVDRGLNTQSNTEEKSHGNV